jgi:hypothetical protein
MYDEKIVALPLAVDGPNLLGQRLHQIEPNSFRRLYMVLPLFIF